jgi:hypothetical protein
MAENNNCDGIHKFSDFLIQYLLNLFENAV